MSFKVNLNCPDCGAVIVIDSMLLIGGASFTCANKECHTAISLRKDEIEKVANAFEEFEELKKTAIEESQKANKH